MARRKGIAGVIRRRRSTRPAVRAIPAVVARAVVRRVGAVLKQVARVVAPIIGR